MKSKLIYLRAEPSDIALLRMLQKQTNLTASEIVRKSLQIGGPILAKTLTRMIRKGSAA